MAEKQKTNLKDILKKLPGNINGWKKSEKTEYYYPENLYKYINGGAELFISYKFKLVYALSFVKEGEQEIKVDIFDMENSINAFGVFSHGREREDNFVSPDIESEYVSGLLTFWKGRYYISILAYPETPDKMKTVKKIAGFIAESIKETGKKSKIISLLPKSGLKKSSIRYFYNHVWLNSYFYLSDKNILNIDHTTSAVMAKYKKNDKEKSTCFLLLLSYTDNNKAKSAYYNFLENYIPKHRNGFFKKNNLWTGSLLRNKLICIVFKAHNLKETKWLINSVIKKGDKSE